MRVASLESVLTAATLVLAIVIVLWGIKIFHGVWAGRAGVGLETSGQEEVRDKGVTSAAAEAFSFWVADASFAGGLSLPTRTEFGLRPAANLAQAAKGIGFKSGMHFGYYLMIAALVLMGLEVLYALYQLVTFL
jgi:hypothetical protein